MTHESAAQYKVGVQPLFSLDVLRTLRAEVDALLGFLQSDSEMEGAKHEAEGRDSTARSVRRGRLSDVADSRTEGAVNHPSLWWFFNKVKRLWLASLKRRSQTAGLSWERVIRLVARFFPPIRTLHPLPLRRFDAKTRGRSPVR